MMKKKENDIFFEYLKKRNISVIGNDESAKNKSINKSIYEMIHSIIEIFKLFYLFLILCFSHNIQKFFSYMNSFLFYTELNITY